MGGGGTGVVYVAHGLLYIHKLGDRQQKGVETIILNIILYCCLIRCDTFASVDILNGLITSDHILLCIKRLVLNTI